MARPQSDLSSRILVAARERFLREGVDGASLRQIAKDAGTNIGMVYYYYPTKDDLFAAVVENVYEKLLMDVVERLAPDVPPEQRILRLYLRVASASDDEFAVVRLILREAMVSSHRLSHIAQRFQRGHLPFVLATLLDGVEGKRFTDRHPPLLLLTSSVALALLPQLIRRLAVEGELPIASALPDAESLARRLHDVLLHGIAGPALEGDEGRKADPSGTLPP
ncbi:MAG: TetR/AcrR family transcriptional regulator [Polyangiales bacterium]